MKVAVFFLAIVACALAYPDEEIDLSLLEPRHIWVDIPGPAPVDNQPSSRIINGQDAAPGSLSFQAGLVLNGRGFCGGSLIRKDFILTAAHCIDDAQEAQVVLGYHVIQDGLQSQSVITSWTFRVHPQWDRSTLTNDVGLIRIPPVNLGSRLSIIPLAAANAPSFAGQLATLSGWGRQSDSSNTIATYLQVIQLEILTNLRCRINFLGQIIADQHICTLGNNGHQNVGACNGDSGGPLVVNGAQVGVVSFGAARCGAGFPSVFARVSEFRSFIDGVLAQ